MKHGDKAMTRLRLRQEAFDKLRVELKPGRKRPGSMKASQPLTTDQYKHGSDRYRDRDHGSAKRAS